MSRQAVDLSGWQRVVDTLRMPGVDQRLFVDLVRGVFPDLEDEEADALATLLAKSDDETTRWLQTRRGFDAQQGERLAVAAEVIVQTGSLPTSEFGRFAVERIAGLETAVRGRLLDLGGHERFRFSQWYRIVAALDSVGDTILALESFLFDKKPAGWGQQYLRLFGMFACVATQQDSVAYLHEVLHGVKMRWEGDSDTIRTLRNKVAVHPAKNGGAVARCQIDDDVLLVARLVEGEWSSDDVNIRTLLVGHLSSVATALERVNTTVQAPSFVPTR